MPRYSEILLGDDQILGTAGLRLKEVEAQVISEDDDFGIESAFATLTVLDESSVEIEKVHFDLSLCLDRNRDQCDKRYQPYDSRQHSMPLATNMLAGSTTSAPSEARFHRVCEMMTLQRL